INRQMTQRATVAINLMQSKPWDFSMIVFRGTDTAQHFLFDRPDLLKKCYMHVDHLLNTILETFPNDTYVIVSDHGFEPIQHVLYPDNVLYTHGYLTPTWNPLQNTSSLILSIAYNLFTRVIKQVPASFIRDSPYLRTFLLTTSAKDKLIDFSQTKAFATADGRGIQICLKSRYTQGIVKDGEYTKICDDLKTIFLSLLHPISGKPLVTNVYHADEIYGLDAEGPPDLVFSLDEGITTSEWIRFPLTLRDLLKKHTHELPITYPCDSIGRSGDHAEHGIFFAMGPNIKSNTNVDNITVEDILPLLFQLFHLPIPDITTGSIPTTIIKDTKISKKVKWDLVHTLKPVLTPKELHKISQLKQQNKKN
ncbi:MAG: alkaline phosphatase family protein, partial [Candidatus Thermoplasmatota archaeon]|nr:alkaline phosphatase family protein [Candidatus Thermoplasmatota archaeon]